MLDDAPRAKVAYLERLNAIPMEQVHKSYKGRTIG